MEIAISCWQSECHRARISGQSAKKRAVGFTEAGESTNG